MLKSVNKQKIKADTNQPTTSRFKSDGLKQCLGQDLQLLIMLMENILNIAANFS